MSNFKGRIRKMIAATLVVMGAAIGWPLSGLVKANSETVITPMQSSGKITKDTDLTFKIEDSDGIAWIYYGWDRHKNQTTGYEATVKGNGGTSQNYTIPKDKMPTEPGLYEFSIRVADKNNNFSSVQYIPYVIVNEGDVSTDTDGLPKFSFDTKKDPETGISKYPVVGATVKQGQTIKFNVYDESGIYYVGYNWLKTPVESGYSSGATYLYDPHEHDPYNENQNSEITLQVPSNKTGEWYLYLFARDGANNVSGYQRTRVIIKEDFSTDELEGLKASIKYLGLVASDYTNWDEQQEAIRIAENALTEYDSVKSKLNVPFLQAKPVDKAQLTQIEEELAKLNQADYTADSWNAIQTKINNAKAQTLQSKFQGIILSRDKKK